MKSRVATLLSAALFVLALTKLVLGSMLGASILLGLAVLAAAYAWALRPVERLPR
jgi:hypothetical protein